MSRALLLITCIIFLGSGCTKEEDLADGIKSSSDEVQTQLIAELDKADIKYDIDNDGFIRYQEKYSTIVEALEKHIIERLYLKYGNQFKDKKEAIAFISYLASKGIDASKATLHSENYVSWQPQDNERLSALLQDFNIEYEKYKSSNN